jgi:hypothetical protein
MSSATSFASVAVVRIEARLAHSLRVGTLIPPLQRFRKCSDLRQTEPKRLADVTNGALRPVRDHGCGERGSLPRVLLVDVLNDLLSTLMLEIHVDIGRLIALLGDEPLHEHLHPRGIHLGDA